MRLSEDHRSSHDPPVPVSEIGHIRDPLLSAAIMLLQRNYSPREPDGPLIDLPSISEERMQLWKNTVASLGCYRGIAVYLITNYECSYGHALEGEVLHTLLCALPQLGIRLSKLPAEDFSRLQNALSPYAQGMRLIAAKLRELGLELHFSTSEQSPYIAYTVLAPGIPLCRGKQKGMVLPL